MIDTLIQKIIDAILSGGAHAVDLILMGIIAWLFFDRNRLLKEIQKKDEKIDKIIDDYYKGNLTLAEALSSLKLVLFEIKGRIL